MSVFSPDQTFLGEISEILKENENSKESVRVVSRLSKDKLNSFNLKNYKFSENNVLNGKVLAESGDYSKAKDVSVAKDLKNSFVIRRGNEEIIIQDGKLLNREALSSGTIEGIDVAAFLAAMKTVNNCFYYCDEHFSYIHSEIEKRIFGIMLDRLGDNEQLIFTTHNMDMLDLNLPKHSYGFLRRERDDSDYDISIIFASEVLKRNTDSVRNAVENDVFLSLPDDSLLDELEVDHEQ